jgi:hypothetical protein
MTIAPFTLHARAGDTFTPTIELRENDDSTPIDLTAGSVEWSLRSGDEVRQYIDSPEASITDAANGVITLSLTAALTRDLYAIAPVWRYEVTITLVAYRQTVLTGALVIAQEVVA